MNEKVSNRIFENRRLDYGASREAIGDYVDDNKKRNIRCNYRDLLSMQK